MKTKNKLILQLYVTGATPNSVRAISNIKKICEGCEAEDFSLEIIDIYKHRELASKEQLLALPMLVKSSPLPMRRLVGDLSDTHKVMEALGLNNGVYEK